MRDNSPIYYAESFITRNYGYGNVLYPALYGSPRITENTATVTSYTGTFLNPAGMDSVDIGGIEYAFMIDESSNVWLVNMTTNTGQKLINNNTSCDNPDIKATGSGVNDKVYFTSAQNVGRIHRGKATGGSSTTLVDTTVDFTTMGLAAGDRVYNITDNKLFTIDAGGIAANTLTITAVSGGDFTNLDYYCVVDPNWSSLTDNKTDYGRQIIEFDEDYYILNGDALAIITSAGAFTAEHKSLESGWIAKSGASNGDTIAIAANKNSLGKIFIWDKNSNGWNRKIQWENAIDSIVSYGNSYIFFSGGIIYFTDGYSTRKLSNLPDVYPQMGITIRPRGMIIYDDRVIINSQNLRSRVMEGIYVYWILRNEWSFTPYDTGTIGSGRDGYSADCSMIYFSSVFNRIYYSFSASGYGLTNTYVLATLFPDDGRVQSCVITNPIKLGKNAMIKKIEVDLVIDPYIDATYTQTITIDCKITDCTRHLWNYAQPVSDSTVLNQITVNGTGDGYNAAKVGDTIFAVEGWNGFLRRVVSSISGEGTATEIWTLDADLPNLMKESTHLITSPFQRYGMTAKSISVTPTSAPLGIQEFYPDLMADNIMVQIYMLATSTDFIPAIKSITIYYE